MIKHIKHHNLHLATLIKSNYVSSGIEFFTPSNFSQQLGYMNRQKGYVIPPHVHNPVSRNVDYTKEVLFIKSGKVRIDFYDDDQNYLESHILNKGDVILLAYGGHGFEMLESSVMIEVKQGPYAGDNDKTRFDPITADKISLKD